MLLSSCWWSNNTRGVQVFTSWATMSIYICADSTSYIFLKEVNYILVTIKSTDILAVIYISIGQVVRLNWPSSGVLVSP
jgi:hypothetical protein